jgi:glycosyltransferase involved in cell wall biosynthesis
MLCLIVSGENNEAVISQIVGNVPGVRIIPPLENVAELYAIADCFVSASRYEGFSYSIGEAMTSGLPVVSSNLSHLTKIYGQAGKGFLTFQNGDAGDLATVLTHVLKTSPEKLYHLGESNSHFIEKNLSIDLWGEKIVNLYHSLISS